MEPRFWFKFLALFALTTSVVKSIHLEFPLLGNKTLSTDPDDVRFYLYNNPSDTTDAKMIFYKDLNSLMASGFDCTKLIKIIIHGYGATATLDTSYFPANAKHEYLNLYERYHYNIFSVDYSNLSASFCDGTLNTFCMPLAIANLKVIGGRVGDFIIWLYEACGGGLSLDSVHVLGHSLSCAIAGHAGETVNRASYGRIRIGRITALDPNDPASIIDMEPTRRLRPTDAMCVDVYHTTSSPGTPDPEGTCDIYINGADKPQPGCSDTGCSHGFAPRFFSWSIATNSLDQVCICESSEEFKLNPDCCDDIIALGEHFNCTTKGKIYAKVDAVPPGFE